MTFEDYLAQVFELYDSNPEWRIGQAHYNTLVIHRPDIERKLPENLDPFYEEAKVPDYLDFVRENWA